MSDEPELPPLREALSFLPAHCGRDYAQASVEGGFLRYDLRDALMDLSVRMQVCRGFGDELFLDKNHDYKSKMYIIEKACLVEGEGIFVLGYWTKEGLPSRLSYQGVSSSGLDYHKKYPPPALYLAAKKKQCEEMDKTLPPDADFLASMGCVCVNNYSPTFPGTIKTLPLDGAADDLVHLSVAFNAAKISWPTMPITTANSLTNESTHEQQDEKRKGNTAPTA